MSRAASVLLLLGAAVVGAGLLGACRQEPLPRPAAAVAGDVRAGQRLMDAYGCGACHAYPGADRATDAAVGPPLDGWSERSFIAGNLPNNQENLVAWISDPQAIEPGTAMPDLGVDPVDALDIAAYLLSLR